MFADRAGAVQGGGRDVLLQCATMPEPVAPRFLADVYEAASRCNKCSLCQAVCPTYLVNPVEWETARGRVALIRDAIEGRLELRDIADGPLS
ncbi:MAG: 4Fe-4S dicluster domain, partial [Chloroflexota bacterium]|nr:4Fe-4S dicluster domain [Chloroflexota bacterium]